MVNSYLPRFDFYPTDFMSPSVQMMSDAERGQYISLMCLQWREGGVLPDDMELLCHYCNVTEISPKVLAKFPQNSEGKRMNVRLDLERRKAHKRVKLATQNGLKGGRPRNRQVSDGKPDPNRAVSGPQTDRKPDAKLTTATAAASPAAAPTTASSPATSTAAGTAAAPAVPPSAGGQAGTIQSNIPYQGKLSPVQKLVLDSWALFGKPKNVVADRHIRGDWERAAEKSLGIYTSEDVLSCLSWSLSHKDGNFSWAEQVTTLPRFVELIFSASEKGLMQQFAASQRAASAPDKKVTAARKSSLTHDPPGTKSFAEGV